VRIYIYMYVYVYTHICVCVCIYMCVCVCVCVCVCAQREIGLTEARCLGLLPCVLALAPISPCAAAVGRRASTGNPNHPWPLQEILSRLGFCARITHPFIAPPPAALPTRFKYYCNTVAQYSTPPLCMPYTIHYCAWQHRVKAETTPCPPQVAFPTTPFGGWKNSGFGREWGDAGLLEYVRHKTVTRAQRPGFSWGYYSGA